MVMEFSVKSPSPILNIWAKGESEITTNLEGAYYKKSSDDNYYLVDNNKENEITFKVIGKDGDYINVGFTGYAKNKEDKNNYYLSSELLKDGYALSAYLNNYTNQFCYKFENFTGKNENIRLFGFTSYVNLIAELRTYSDENSRRYHFEDGRIDFRVIEEYNILCFYIDKKINETIFYFQIYSNMSLISKLYVLEPQSNGIFYFYRITPSTKMILVPKIPKKDENILYYLYSNSFSSYLYSVDCDNYPLCTLNDSILNNISPALTLGKMSSINLKKDETYDFSPINKHQKLYVVKCDENSKKDCDFLTLISSNNKEITIRYVDNILGRYSFKNQIDKYKINNLLYFIMNGIDEFLVEISVSTGEVDIISDFPKGIILNRINNVNKISLYVKFENWTSFDSFNFSVISLENSFYSVLYYPNIVYKPLDVILPNNIFSYGTPRLFFFSNKYLNDSSSQLLYLRNLNEISGIIKTVNFLPLNCEIEVYLTNIERDFKEKLIKYDNFYHHAPTEMKSSFDNYSVKIKNYDLFEYNNKVCQVYLSYVDNLVKDSNKNYVDLLIFDNIPQQIMFNKNLTHVSYGYYHTKPENDLMIKYSSKNKVKYIAKFYYSNKKREKEDNIMGDGIIYLNHEEWENICKNQICFIKIDISLDNTNLNLNDEPILELSFKAIEEKKVSYIPKRQFMKDFILDEKSQYYYTEIGKNEAGIVNVHFLKGSGEIYGKIVEVDKIEKIQIGKGNMFFQQKIIMNLEWILSLKR